MGGRSAPASDAGVGTVCGTVPAATAAPSRHDRPRLAGKYQSPQVVL